MALWLAPHPLVLASRSAIRKTLFEAAGIPVVAAPAPVDERELERERGVIEPQETALMLAREKARAVASGYPGRLVVGADQTLDLAGVRFSKPANRDAAREQLRQLRGRTHALHSAATVAVDDTIVFSIVASAELTMRAFSDAFLETYLEHAPVTESVGGYQLEGLGIQLFERVAGDHHVILGLPLLALIGYLRQAGYLAS